MPESLKPSERTTALRGGVRIGFCGRGGRESGFRSHDLSRPPAVLMNHHVHSVDHQFDRGRSSPACRARMIYACRQARKIRHGHRRQPVHAPSCPIVAADFQLQTHGQLCSKQRAVNEHKQQPQRQKANRETDQHQEGAKELKRRYTPCALQVACTPHSFGRRRLVANSTPGDIQERHLQTPFLTRRAKPL